MLSPFAIAVQIDAKEQEEIARRECEKMSSILLDDAIASAIECYVASMNGRKYGNYSTEQLVAGAVVLRITGRKPVRGSDGEWVCHEYTMDSPSITRLQSSGHSRPTVRVFTGYRHSLQSIILEQTADRRWRMVSQQGFQSSGRRAGVRIRGNDPGRRTPY